MPEIVELELVPCGGSYLEDYDAGSANNLAGIVDRCFAQCIGIAGYRHHGCIDIPLEGLIKGKRLTKPLEKC